MKLKLFFLSCTSAAFLMGAAPVPQVSSNATLFSVLNLQEGETLSVSYIAMGCFHQESGVMEFTANDVTYQGMTKPLTRLQATQLDNYLRVITEQQGELGGCTTAVSLNLTLRGNGRAVYERELTDDFCLGFSDPIARDEEKLLSPGHIKYDLFESNPTEQQGLTPGK